MPHPPAFRHAGLIALALWSGSACSPGEEEAPDRVPGNPIRSLEGRPDILLLTLDTTRADRLGCYGREEANTPVFDACARQGILFENAYCAAPITLPSHVSILTGTYPCAHQVRDNGLFILGDEAVSIAEVLQEQGYQTGAFVGSYVVDSSYGTGQGFDHFSHATEIGPAGMPRTEIKAERSVEKLTEWLQTLDDDRPYFIWLHFMDPHIPYSAPREFVDQNPDPYDAEIAYSDHQYGRVLAAIEERYPDRGLLQILTADHGESKGEHDEESHGAFVYDAVTRIPFIIVPPKGSGAEPTRVTGRVSNVSIPSTLTTILGLEEPGLATLLNPLVDADYRPLLVTDPIYLETYLTFYSYRWAPEEALIDGDLKFVHTKRDELYHLGQDAGETQDLAEAEPDEVARMRSALAAFKSKHAPLGWETTHAISPEEALMLESLGYQEAIEGLPDFTLPDPKDAIKTAKWLDYARGFAEGGKTARRNDPAEAEKLFGECEKFLAKVEEIVPEGVGLQEMRGRLEFYRGRRKRATPHFERAAHLVPRMPQYHFFLGECYYASGKVEWALREHLKCIQLQPNFVQSYQSLGRILDQQGRLGEAVWMGRLLLASLEKIGAVPVNTRKAIALTEKKMKDAGMEPVPLDLGVLSFQPEGLLHQEEEGDGGSQGEADGGPR